MIIKIGQPLEGLGKYVRQDRYVMAKRMRESFMVETAQGWSGQGKPGDWLVLVGAELWTAIAHEQFTRIYRPYKEGEDCVGPCELVGAERGRSAWNRTYRMMAGR